MVTPSKLTSPVSLLSRSSLTLPAIDPRTGGAAEGLFEGWSDGLMVGPVGGSGPKADGDAVGTTDGAFDGSSVRLMGGPGLIP